MSTAVDAETEVKKVLDEVVSNLGNAHFGYSFDTIGEYLAKDHTRFFEEQRDPTGKPWKPLNNRAIDSRWLRQLGGGTVGSGRQGKILEPIFLAQGFRPDDTILIDTGALRISLAYRGSPNHVEISDSLNFEFGTSVEYASIHQYGGTSRTYDERSERWIDIVTPARPMVGWSENSVNEAVEIVADEAVLIAISGL